MTGSTPATIRLAALLLLGASAATAIDVPAPGSRLGPRSPLARPLERWEAERREILDQVRAAMARVAELETTTTNAPDGPGGKAQAESALLLAQAALRARQAEAAMVEADLLEAKHKLHWDRQQDLRPRREFSGRALIQLCRARADQAVRTAILAIQDAEALTAKGELRQAVAVTMARAAEAAASLEPELKEDAGSRLEMLLAAWEHLITCFDRADETAGVHLEFLEAQEAELLPVLADLLKQRQRVPSDEVSKSSSNEVPGRP